MDVHERVASVLRAEPQRPALEFAGVWYPRGAFAALADRLEALLDEQGIAAGARVGLIARNRPSVVAAFAALVARRRTVVMIHPAQSQQGLARDILSLALSAVLADAPDFGDTTLAAAREAGSAALSLIADTAGGFSIACRVRGTRCPETGPEPRGDGAAVMELLSSGTTGAPKRVPLSARAFALAAEDATAVYASGASEADAVAVMFHPLGNVAGVTFLLPLLLQGRPLALLERFELDAWLAAVRRHRPARVSLPPAVLRQLLDRDVPRDDLASLAAIGVGAAPLDPQLQDEFESRYCIPLLTAYGATEFCGVVANWTLLLYREHGAAKRGSVGRARPGVRLRVVGTDSGCELAAGEIGLLEARVERIGADWIHTRDLARLDADGFLYLCGRADGAINRGGFKIIPEAVAAALREHPQVADAAVIGVDDARLGQVPAAAVELRAAAAGLASAELEQHLRERLLPYQIPALWLIVAQLPRNASMKVNLPELRQMFADSAARAATDSRIPSGRSAADNQPLEHHS